MGMPFLLFGVVSYLKYFKLNHSSSVHCRPADMHSAGPLKSLLNDSDATGENNTDALVFDHTLVGQPHTFLNNYDANAGGSVLDLLLEIAFTFMCWCLLLLDIF